MGTADAFDLRLLLIPSFSAIVGFLLALLTFYVTERVKARRERNALAALFATHIRQAWQDIAQLGAALPDKEYFARMTHYKYGIDELCLTGEPEYHLPVDSIYLYETYGIKLAGLVRGKTRKQLWRCYDIVKKAEDVRLMMKALSLDEKDNSGARKLFKGLVISYANELIKLEKRLPI